MFLALTLAALLVRQIPGDQEGPKRTYESEFFMKDGKEVKVEVTYATCVHVSSARLPSGEDPALSCVNTCKGGVHKKHEECDFSCDTQCDQKHMVNLHGTAQKDVKGFMDRLDEIAKLWFGKGFTNKFPYQSLIDLSYDVYNQQVEKFKDQMDYSGAIDHFGKPCSICTADNLYRVYDVGVTMVRRTIGRDGKEIQKSGTVYAFIGAIYVPDPDNKLVNVLKRCACENAPAEKTSTGQHVSAPGIRLETKDGQYLPMGDNSCTFEVMGCDDMNNLQIAVTNHCDSDLVCEINPGTICVGPKEYQQMMITEFNRKNIPGKKNLWASLGGGAIQEPVVFKVQATCIEMHKDMPAEGAKYTALPTAPDGLAALGRVISNEAIQGPWDQAMIWMWTDHASLDQTNDRLLLLKCPPGQFLWSLMNVARLGLKPFSEIKPFLHPEYALAWNARSDATKWFLRTEEGLDPAGLATVVGQGLGGMADKLKANGPVTDIQHVADIASELGGSNDPKLQMLALRILAEVVPEDDQYDFIRRGGASALPLLVVDGSPDTKTKATEVAKSWQAKIDKVDPALSDALHALLG
ncbi:MAG TPA: hypothetical protein VHE55_04930 [Fimbriimonadaceae bacterium]|nr:hypothetical protein [Fimbriimonadaceae bacterium]